MSRWLKVSAMGAALILLSLLVLNMEWMRVNKVDAVCAVLISKSLKAMELDGISSIKDLSNASWDAVECFHFPGQVRVYFYAGQKGVALEKSRLGGDATFWFDSETLDLLEVVYGR